MKKISHTIIVAALVILVMTVLPAKSLAAESNTALLVPGFVIEGDNEVYNSPSDGESVNLPAQDYATDLYQKRILIIGDSYSTGFRMADPALSWPNLLTRIYGMEMTLDSVRGSGFSTSGEEGYFPGGHYEPIATRDLPDDDFDIVIVEGEGNDWYMESPIGEDSDTETNTFCGAVNTILSRVEEKYPNALKIVMAPGTGYGDANSLGLTESDYQEALIRLGRAHSFSIFDVNTETDLIGSDLSKREAFFAGPTDGWHLNTNGHIHLLSYLVPWLEEKISSVLLVGSFYDVQKKDWFSEDIAYVTENELMSGISTHIFSPNEDASRASLAMVLWKIAGSKTPESNHSPFHDVPEDAWYKDAVAWTWENKMLSGTGENTFEPDAVVTREQIAVAFYRYAGSPEITEDLSSFADAEDISSYAQKAVSWAVNIGLFDRTNESLRPKEAATRAELAALVHRFSTLDIGSVESSTQEGSSAVSKHNTGKVGTLFFAWPYNTRYALI